MGDVVFVETTLAVTLETALHIGTGLGLAQILDDRVVQGPHRRHSNVDLPYLPGSSLKGRLRAHARQLSAALGWAAEDRTAAERALFGFDHHAGGLVFPDLHLTDEIAATLARQPQLRPYLTQGARSFVSLSRARRVALEGRLFRLELVERNLTFDGVVCGYLPATTAQRDLGLLLAATCELTHLGGHKGRGLGKCAVRASAAHINTQPEEWSELVRKLPCANT